MAIFTHKTHHEKHQGEKGFTLLELLLVIGVTSMIFIGIATLTQSWANTEIATSSGQYLQRVTTVTAKFVDANWGLPLINTDNVLAYATANPGTAWDDLVTSLDEEGLLIGGVLRNPLGSDMIISYRTTGVAPNLVYRTAIYTDTPMSLHKVTEAARQAGNTGGTISVQRNGGLSAVGAFGQYDVLLTNLAVAPLACIPNAKNACLIAVIARNSSQLNAAYLYRNDIATDNANELNTMTTDLLMNGNNVLGAGAVNTRDLNVAGDANLGTTTVTGPSTFNGATNMTAGVDVNGGMDVTGNANFSNNVTMANGTVNVDTLNSDTIRSAKIATNEFAADNLTMDGGVLTVNDDINVNGNMTSGGQVYADTINAGVINANGGDMTVGTMEVKNAMQIDGAVTVTGGAIAVDHLVSDNCTRVFVGLAYDITDGVPDGYENYGTCP